MNTSRFQLPYFLFILLVVAVLTFFIFLPFVIVLALAATVAVVIYPVYEHILKIVRGKAAIASLLTILILLVIILLPLTLITLRLINESTNLYGSISSSYTSVSHISEVVNNKARLLVPDANIDLRLYLTEASAWLFGHLTGLFSGTLDLLIKLFLGIIALFYFLKDGQMFKEHISLLSPLPDNYDTTIFTTLKRAIRSVLIGSVIVALVQGFLSGIGYAIFGVPNPTLWGTVTAVAALVPGVGTSLVIIPVVLYLLLAKTGFAWLGMAIWGAFAVGLIDNFLGPKLVERGINIHPLLILFSILGGVSFFGPEGFILGPLVLSLLFSLIKMYNELVVNKSHA